MKSPLSHTDVRRLGVVLCYAAVLLNTAAAQERRLEEEVLPDETTPQATRSAAAVHEASSANLAHAYASPLDLISASTPLVRVTSLKLIEDGHKRLARGEVPQAVDAYERAIEVDPNNAVGYFFLGQMYFDQQQYDQASAFASRAVNLGTPMPPLWQSRFGVLQGNVLAAVGRFAEARQTYERSLLLDPDNAAARAALARSSGH